MKTNYILKYREPGKRPNTERWAKRPVENVQDAVNWMNANRCFGRLTYKALIA